MKYEIVRAWDATRFGPGIGFIGYLTRESINTGEDIILENGEYGDELQKELLTGKVILRAVRAIRDYDYYHWEDD